MSRLERVEQRLFKASKLRLETERTGMISGLLISLFCTGGAGALTYFFLVAQKNVPHSKSFLPIFVVGFILLGILVGKMTAGSEQRLESSISNLPEFGDMVEVYNPAGPDTTISLGGERVAVVGFGCVGAVARFVTGNIYLCAVGLKNLRLPEEQVVKRSALLLVTLESDEELDWTSSDILREELELNGKAAEFLRSLGLVEGLNKLYLSKAGVIWLEQHQ